MFVADTGLNSSRTLGDSPPSQPTKGTERTAIDYTALKKIIYTVLKDRNPILAGRTPA